MKTQLQLGDCIEEMQKLPNGTVDMVLTDLPYGTTANKWDSIIPLDALWSAWKRICKPGAAIVLFTQQPFTTVVAASNLEQLKTELIWEKQQGTNFLNARKYPMKVHENILVFCEGLPRYNPQMTSGHAAYVTGKHKGSSNYRSMNHSGGRIDKDGLRFPRSVLQFTAERGSHPTQKPIALCGYLIRTYTNQGDTVLDCTMGSGSTLVAAIRERRHSIGIERDPDYFAIAHQRVMTAIAAGLVPAD